MLDFIVPQIDLDRPPAPGLDLALAKLARNGILQLVEERLIGMGEHDDFTAFLAALVDGYLFNRPPTSVLIDQARQATLRTLEMRDSEESAGDSDGDGIGAGSAAVPAPDSVEPRFWQAHEALEEALREESFRPAAPCETCSTSAGADTAADTSAFAAPPPATGAAAGPEPRIPSPQSPAPSPQPLADPGTMLAFQQARTYILDQCAANKPIDRRLVGELTRLGYGALQKFITETQAQGRQVRVIQERETALAVKHARNAQSLSEQIASIHEADPDDDEDDGPSDSELAALDRAMAPPRKVRSDAGTTGRKPISDETRAKQSAAAKARCARQAQERGKS